MFHLHKNMLHLKGLCMDQSQKNSPDRALQGLLGTRAFRNCQWNCAFSFSHYSCCVSELKYQIFLCKEIFWYLSVDWQKDAWTKREFNFFINLFCYILLYSFFAGRPKVTVNGVLYFCVGELLKYYFWGWFLVFSLGYQRSPASCRINQLMTQWQSSTVKS